MSEATGWPGGEARPGNAAKPARSSRWLPPGRRRALGWAALALFLSLGLARLHDYRGWDQSFYLAQTSSLAEDGDVDLRNDLLHLQREPTTLLRALTTLEPNGAVANTFAIGASLLWLPPYALGVPLRALADDPEARWARPQLAALQLFALALMVWLLWAFDRWLRRMGAARSLAALGAAALVLGTPLVIYGFRGYMGSHQASAVAVMLLVLATLRLGSRGTAGAAWLWGIALGLVFLCRWQDAVKGIVVLVPILELRRRNLAAGRWAVLAAAAAAGALLMAGVQLEAWLLERGRIFGLPQGAGYLDLSDPEIGRFLLSGLSGLLPWSPLFAVGMVGLLLPWRSRLHVSWRWVALVLLVFDVYLNATVDDWWGGASYGARRMCSDVPLLALGLGNLAAWRRLRWPLAVLLAGCCLWGGVTANLRVHGLRDLSILARGVPSAAPGAERESGVQPSRAEAIDVATSWPFRLGRMTYFAGRWGPGRALTVAIGALVCLLAGWLLGRARAPDRLALALLAVLALAAFAHLRLLRAVPADGGERQVWIWLARAADGRAQAELSPGLTAIAGREDRFVEARRFLRLEATRVRGNAAAARALAAELPAYPFRRPLLDQLALAPGERSLLARDGFFHRVRRQRPGRELAVARRIDLACEALRLEVAVRMPTAAVTAGPLVSLGRRGEPPLATVRITGGGRLALDTASASQESALGRLPGEVIELRLDWSPVAETIALAVAGPNGGPVGLAAPAPAPPSGPGRFQVVLGSLPEGAATAEPPWGAQFSDLRVVARRVCGRARDGAAGPT